MAIKVCKFCKQPKERSIKNFHYDLRNIDNYKNWCKDCDRKRQGFYRARRKRQKLLNNLEKN